jgi:beta-N-acetylhexosaminidase
MTSSIGPLVVDLHAYELDAEEREFLQHPLIGGLIFFARNFDSPKQIAGLCRHIRMVRKKPILITVDQEGGRVQRFRNGFTRLPSMGQLGRLYQASPEIGLRLATTCGWMMAAELLAVGVDLSFAPVLDVDKGMSTMIGDRAFDRRPDVVIPLAKALTAGMREAGMASVGKHFPGHGSVSVDSHMGLPIDNRSFEQIAADDLIPFAEMMQAGMESVMAAHILFPAVHDKPVGFSLYWLQDVLRQQLAFSGLVFSDALDMHGADTAGGFPERVTASLEAGCDMALICNNRESVIKTLDGLPADYRPVAAEKWQRVQGDFTQISTPLKNSRAWQEKYTIFANLMDQHHVVTME